MADNGGDGDYRPSGGSFRDHKRYDGDDDIVQDSRGETSSSYHGNDDVKLDIQSGKEVLPPAEGVWSQPECSEVYINKAYQIDEDEHEDKINQTARGLRYRRKGPGKRGNRRDENEVLVSEIRKKSLKKILNEEREKEDVTVRHYKDPRMGSIEERRQRLHDREQR